MASPLALRCPGLPPGCLTFDDGPGPSTQPLLDVLDAAGYRATFFALGANLAQAMDVAVRIVAGGHVLGNHTFSHARPGALTHAALVDEVATTDAWIRRAYGAAGRTAPDVIPVRLPYGVGANDPRVAVLRRLGRVHVDWTLLLPDWQRPAPASSQLADMASVHVRACLASGRQPVLCLHDGSRHREPRRATVEAVRCLLSGGSARVG